MHQDIVFLAVGGILALSVLIAMAASRVNIPWLIAFLGLGMLLGVGGTVIIRFTNVQVAQTVGTVGLAVILFEGGLSTSWRRLREVVLPATMLGTIGVIITAVLTGMAACVILGLPWLYGLLLGAVVSSTDAAAVFATLRFTAIKRRLARTLEAETGGNDPMAIALTMGFISWIQQPTYGLHNVALLLAHELGFGLIVGAALGGAAMWVFARLPSTIGVFAPVASVAAGALAFGAASSIGGSGFLAIYLVGLAIGSTPSRYRSQITTFHEGFAFLAQVALFIVLGLLVSTHDLLPVAGASILLSLLLVFVIRPLAVTLSIPLGFTLRERTLIGWAGLRGAVPIVLGTFVLTAHIAHGSTIFNVVFFVVIISTLIQGTTLERLAKRLHVVDSAVSPSPVRDAADIKWSPEHVEFKVEAWHAIAGSKIRELGLPRRLTVNEVRRSGKVITPTGKLVLRAGDRLYVTVPESIRPEVEDVITRWQRRV